MKTDNELIADFLGLGWHDNGTVSHFPSVLKMRMGVDTKADLKFDTSWDWLMPVLIKVKEQFGLDVWAGYEIDPNYNQAVEIIKWHNSQAK